MCGCLFGCLLLCLFVSLSRACRGVMPPFGAVPSVRRTGSSRHAEWYTRAETSGWHFRRRSVPDLALSPPLLEFDACSSRDSAPLASGGARPATGMSTGSATSSLASHSRIAPASHRSGTASGRKSTPGESANRCQAIRVAYGAARHQVAQ